MKEAPSELLGKCQAAIRGADFVGIVPTSRGAHCRPLHPWLASVQREAWCRLAGSRGAMGRGKT
jgi:hypothetical protein